MNPIFKTIVILLIYIVLAILCVFLIKDRGGTEMPLVIIMYSFYIAPFACIIVFAINLFFNQVWLQKHIIWSVVFSIFLISWASYILVYLHSLVK
jgi:hypothetical protein